MAPAQLQHGRSMDEADEAWLRHGLGTAEARLLHSCGTAVARLWHGCGMAAARLQ